MIGNTMKLREYLFFNNLTLVEMAEKLMIAPNHLGGISRGERKPSIRLAKSIEMVTDGEVTADDVMNQEPIKKKPKNKKPARKKT